MSDHYGLRANVNVLLNNIKAVLRRRRAPHLEGLP